MNEAKPAKEEENEEVEPPNKRGKMGKCEVCQEKEANYRCPGCGIVFCSLECCKEHKAIANCSGKRDRAAFVPLEKFSDQHMLSDFCLLEETLRKKNSSYRTLKTITSGTHPYNNQNLISKARDRGTTLILMPNGMSRRESNTTSFDRKSGTLFWKVEFIFSQQHKLLADKTNENHTLQSVLEKTLSDPCVRHELNKEPALNEPISSLVFLLIDPDSPSHAPKHFELDSTQSIKQNLAQKRILEHPQICVITKSELSKFMIIKKEEISPPPPPQQTKLATESL